MATLPAQWLTSTLDIQQESSVIPLPSLINLPDAGLPCGAIVQLSCTHRLSHGTSIALDACAEAQNQAILKGGSPAWCAWIDPSRSLHAPGAASHGVHLERLLVVQPPSKTIGTIALHIIQSSLFPLLIIDIHGIPGASQNPPMQPWLNMTRRLAIAARETNTCVVLLTDPTQTIPYPLPVALRLELQQPKEGTLRMKVTKERRGRLNSTSESVYTCPLPGRLARSA
jgi:recombination protein RecA